MQQPIQFFHRGRIVDVHGTEPTLSVLDWLREEARCTGTKEGCNEGDCGACTVVIGELAAAGEKGVASGLRLRPVNACIQFLPTLHGKALFTVEDLKDPARGLHPVQQAMVDCHGSQCGFCTPGFVMSLWSAYEHHQEHQTRPTRQQLADTLSGNLCRCTGYRPILDAGQRMFDAPAVRLDTQPVVAALTALRHARGMERLDRFHAPATLDELAALREARPAAQLLAGSTDVGLWVNKQFRDLGEIIHVGEVAELKVIEERADALYLGAGASLESSFAALAQRVPGLRDVWRRFAAPPVRNAGTIGGNVANGSPIGDLPPVLMALDAWIELRRGQQTRRMPLTDFYVDYMKNRMQPGEFVQGLGIPKAALARQVRAWKISKRFDCDISALCGALAIELDGHTVKEVRLAFGGMAAIVKRAAHAEAALAGQPWTLAAVNAAKQALAQDFTPLSDLRASADYRLRVARNLLQRLWLETRADDPLPVESTSVWNVAMPHGAAEVKTDAAAEARACADGARVGISRPHESAALHVAGEAAYIDDLPELTGTLHCALGLSPVANGRLKGMRLDAIRAMPGVVAVLTAADIPGRNDCGPIVPDDPILCSGDIGYLGQPVFAVIAHTHDAARRAAARAKDALDIEAAPPVLTPQEAHEKAQYVVPPMHLARSTNADGARAAIAQAPHRLKAEFHLGGQEQFYLEGQISYAIPQEGGAMRVHCSTQHPSEVQHQVAHALHLHANAVQVECRRMGGGFGGKESQPALFACIAAVAAHRLKRPVKLRLDRDDDFMITGRRHCFWYEYEAGYDDEGRILGVEVTMVSRAGHSADLSGPVMTRALCHFDNAYWLPDVAMHGFSARTNTQSNTAFRGFGGPQGAIAIENILDSVARKLGRDPLDVRRVNFYGQTANNVTPYGEVVTDNIIHELVADLEASSDYRARRRDIAAFNATSAVLRRGIALTPLKFGISFNVKHFNQAGALVHVYTDGSILVNHGGTEMGQGLNTKVAQVVAHELGVGFERVRSSATDTQKIANTSATAASTGADLNGKAAQDAARQIRERLAACAAARYGGEASAVRFANDRIEVNGHTLPFTTLVGQAYLDRVQLWSDGFYATPGLSWDGATMQGRPFYYFAYGAAVSEVIIDTLTGEWKLLCADILHDVGKSLNPAIDIGQIEGAFIQGMGWLTTEELVWHPKTGALATHAPSTYKIPTANDCPPALNVRLYDGQNLEDSIHRSKAVGEPPLLLSFSVFYAIRDAVSSVGGHQADPPLRAPATSEAILRAIDAVREAAASPRRDGTIGDQLKTRQTQA
jgi:xanthine dehydrogenase large subunit